MPYLKPERPEKVSAPSLRLSKQRGERLVCLTAYDYPTARIVDEAGIDIILVGDSLGNVSLIIPKDVNARVTVDSAAVNINHGSNWSQNGKDYTQEGQGPTLTFIVKMAAGNLLISDD